MILRLTCSQTDLEMDLDSERIKIILASGQLFRLTQRYGKLPSVWWCQDCTVGHASPTSKKQISASLLSWWTESKPGHTALLTTLKPLEIGFAGKSTKGGVWQVSFEIKNTEFNSSFVQFSTVDSVKSNNAPSSFWLKCIFLV